MRNEIQNERHFNGKFDHFRGVELEPADFEDLMQAIKNIVAKERIQQLHTVLIEIDRRLVASDVSTGGKVELSNLKSRIAILWGSK